MDKTWKPVAGGICSIIGGAFAVIGGVLLGFFGMWTTGMMGMWGMWNGGMMVPGMGNLFGLFGLPAILLGIVAIIGGVVALRRQQWGLALAGAICAVLTPMSFVLGAVAVVFIALSRCEFR